MDFLVQQSADITVYLYTEYVSSVNICQVNRVKVTWTFFLLLCTASHMGRVCTLKEAVRTQPPTWGKACAYTWGKASIPPPIVHLTYDFVRANQTDRRVSYNGAQASSTPPGPRGGGNLEVAMCTARRLYRR